MASQLNYPEAVYLSVFFIFLPAVLMSPEPVDQQLKAVSVISSVCFNKQAVVF